MSNETNVKVYNITTYKALKMVNVWLEKEGVNKVLPDPMIFNYVKKGFIPSSVTKEGKRINEDDLKAWFTKYFKKNFNKDVEKAF